MKNKAQNWTIWGSWLHFAQFPQGGSAWAKPALQSAGQFETHLILNEFSLKSRCDV